MNTPPTWMPARWKGAWSEAPEIEARPGSGPVARSARRSSVSAAPLPYVWTTALGEATMSKFR